jgi:hypothetical protein
MIAAHWMLLLVMLLLANMPFITDRWLGLWGSHKAFGGRALEWLGGFILWTLLAWLLERQMAPPHDQKWHFFVTTLVLFGVAAFPGFVWRYFWRKPGV